MLTFFSVFAGGFIAGELAAVIQKRLGRRHAAIGARHPHDARRDRRH